MVKEQCRWKRTIDVIGASVLLVITSPVLLVAGIVVWKSLGRPVLFRHMRPGRHEVPFELIKFRTMADEFDERGRRRRERERITRTTAFLRRISIDELPQLLNVLRGDMSLVGPRPLLQRYLEYFTLEERTRFQVRPGITGLAQISGRNDLPWAARLAYDVEYAGRHSCIADVKILLRTILVVLNGSGLQVAPSERMADFDAERRAHRAGKEET